MVQRQLDLCAINSNTGNSGFVFFNILQQETSLLQHLTKLPALVRVKRMEEFNFVH